MTSAPRCGAPGIGARCMAIDDIVRAVNQALGCG
jgi:hypothetical protein